MDERHRQGRPARRDDRGGGSREQPLRPRRSPAPPKPTLPRERPMIQREAWRDLKAAAGPGRLEDVARAYAAAGEALESGDIDRALELLTWAKSAASRSAVVREALGVARYLAGDYAAAHSELLTYRRLSNRQDQNHLLADSARALGRHEKVGEYVAAMNPRRDGVDRWVEALIVLAGDQADRGDVRGGLATLERAGLQPSTVEAWHPRLWYAAGDLAERAGDRERARELFEAVRSVDAEFLDVDERIEALED